MSYSIAFKTHRQCHNFRRINQLLENKLKRLSRGCQAILGAFVPNKVAFLSSPNTSKANV